MYSTTIITLLLCSSIMCSTMDAVLATIQQNYHYYQQQKHLKMLNLKKLNLYYESYTLIDQLIIITSNNNVVCG
jgi:uncharacterized membrane protein